MMAGRYAFILKVLNNIPSVNVLTQILTFDFSLTLILTLLLVLVRTRVLPSPCQRCQWMVANTRCDCNLRVILYVGKVSRHRKVLAFCSVFWCHSLIQRCLQGAFKIRKLIMRLSIRPCGFLLKKIKKEDKTKSGVPLRMQTDSGLRPFHVFGPRPLHTALLAL